MRIKSVSIGNHKVLGSIKIDLFGDSESLQENVSNDINIEIEENGDKNFYTYIIGQNGVGKTVLFRAITHFINFNSQEDPKLKRIVEFYPTDNQYQKLYNHDAGYNELVKLGSNPNYNNTLQKHVDFLALFDAQLIYITSSFESGIVHRNRLFRSFNYLSGINKTKILFLNAFIKFHTSQKLGVLNGLLKKENASWNIQCKFTFDVHNVDNIPHVHIQSKHRTDITVLDFLSLVDKIIISSNDILDTSNLNGEEKRIFEILFNSGAFFKLYYNSELSFIDLFNTLKRSSILAKIDNFIRMIIAAKDHFESEELVFDAVEILNAEKQLTTFNVFLLGLLENLQLIEVNIFCNGIPIEKMSSGEQSMIRLFSYFADLPIPEKRENLIKFFDEPENTLHPKWQHDFSANFKKIVEDVYEIKKSHFIFATHSPLMIMKATTEANRSVNVLRLSKDEKGLLISQQIENVSSYSIEETLLDEFKISYRDKELEIKVENILREKNSERAGKDPIDTIINSFDLRKKIAELVNKLNSQQ